MLKLKKTGSSSIATASVLFTLLLCAACSKNQSTDPAPDSAAKPEAPAAPQATGLVKNPVKMTDTADAVKWMDMASTKSPAQIAKEEKLAKDAKDAKLAADAKAARDAKLASDAKLAADNKLAADAKAAADARDLAAKTKEAQRVAAAAAAQATSAPAAVVAQEPVLKVISKEQPKYPKEAQIDGITSGKVTAQVRVEADGSVSKVDIVKATPRKYFDKAVVAAALQWKYSPISKPMTAILEFNFKLDTDGS